MYVDFIRYQDFCLSSGNLFPILRSMRASQEVNIISIKKVVAAEERTVFNRQFR